jgi:hypothetical protein
MVRLKALILDDETRFRNYFNSNMVRLKAAVRIRFRLPIFNFNSNMVRLKDKNHTLGDTRKNYFNSNMVRLKVEYQEFCAKVYHNFNSNMVRLKVRRISRRKHIFIFQFQYGAIKRPRAPAQWIHVKRISIPIWCD